MPTIQSAKVISENALSTIGAFPASRPAPDPGEMKKALRWLEMLLNYETAIRPVGGFWQVIEIPLEAGVGDYEMADYVDERGVCHIFSVFIVDQNGDTDPLAFEFESDAIAENLRSTGRPLRATATKDTDMVLSVYPTPTQVEQDAGLVLRIRIQTFHDKIDDTGSGDTDVRLRPSWYLWATKRLAYEIGSGPVRRLGETELKRFDDDATKLENALLARDNTTPKPPVTEPMDPTVDIDSYPGSPGGYRRRY